jgi:hypothetical protein
VKENVGSGGKANGIPERRSEAEAGSAGIGGAGERGGSPFAPACSIVEDVAPSVTGQTQCPPEKRRVDNRD